MIAIGNNEIAAAPALGEMYQCPRCDRAHEVKDSVPPGVLQFVNCGDKSYLVGIKWKAIR